MKMQNIIFLILLSNMLFANSYISNTHNTTETFLYDVSDYLDTRFSGQDYDIDKKSLTKAEISYESVFEKDKSSYSNGNVRIRLLFPRFRKKYKVTFENYVKSKSIDDTQSSKSYLLGISHNKARLGLKFRGINPDPFISYNIEKQLNLYKNWDFYIGNKAIYFADYKFDNIFSINLEKKIDDSTRFAFKNSYRFQEEYNDKYELVHSLNLYKDLGDKQKLNYTISSYATKDNIKKELEVDYYYTGVSYRKFYYKNWAYYQVDTGLTFRDENHFDARGRMMIKLGIVFGNAKLAK